MDIHLKRILKTDLETLGCLTVDGFRCFTLELPDKDNAPNISCIPAGAYTWKKRVSPGKGYEVIELQNVPNRSYIQLHTGNFTKQIQGCILPGLGLSDIDKDGTFDVSNSEAAFSRIMSLTGDTGTILIED